MGYFPDAIAAHLAGRTVRATTLVHFDFLSAPKRLKRLWPGFGPLRAGGHTWSGLGELGSISGLESALGGTAPETAFTLSGVDPSLVAETLAAPQEVKNRLVTVFLQVFDETLQPLDQPFALYIGRMDVMKIRSNGPSMRTITVTAETLFVARAFAPWGRLSDRDQKARFPGDHGLAFIAGMAAKTVIWPPPFDLD